jgi:predicted RNA-binding protein with RPS1 domain
MADDQREEVGQDDQQAKDVGEGTPLDVAAGFGVVPPVVAVPEAPEPKTETPSAPAGDEGAPQPESPPETPAAPEREEKRRPGGGRGRRREKPREDVDYGSTFRPLKEGDVVKGTVVHIDKEGLLVDIGTKSEGIVPPREISPRQVTAEHGVSVGDEIDVYVMHTDDEEEGLVLSKKRADFEKAWERILEAHDQGTVIQAMVTDRVKGGLVVDLGLRGFVPASHVGSGRPQNLERLVGQSLPLRVIEVDRDRRKVILSHRLALDEERKKQREETLDEIKEGQIRAGIVRRLTNYGAFVDLGGIDGLLHISEMSWTRIKHPSDLLRVGEKIQVVVLKLSLDQNRISLGMRQILPDPWSSVYDDYQVGDVVPGTVSRLVPFGAFVQLETGIEGIVPNIELAEHRVNKPEQILSVGEAVNVKILDIRGDERRMTLSLREAPQPEKPERKRGPKRTEEATQDELAEEAEPAEEEDSIAEEDMPASVDEEAAAPEEEPADEPVPPSTDGSGEEEPAVPVEEPTGSGEPDEPESTSEHTDDVPVEEPTA